MKKSVVIIISVIYIASIILVGFLGRKMKVYDEITYVNDIVCVADGLENSSTKLYDYNYVIDYEEDVVVTIRSSVRPDNATNTKVEYHGHEYFVNQNTIECEFPEFNTIRIKFKDSGSIIFYVRSTDNKNVEKSIRVFAKDF